MSEEAAMMISALMEQMVQYAVAKFEKEVQGYVSKRNGRRTEVGNKRWFERCPEAVNPNPPVFLKIY